MAQACPQARKPKEKGKNCNGREIHCTRRFLHQRSGRNKARRACKQLQGGNYLGLCYGMQMAVIEFARNVCGFKDAHTTECNPKTSHPVIHILPEKYQVKQMGGTLRLGAWPCKIKKGSLADKIYKSELVHERHRHRYEVNPDYIKRLEEKGLVFSGSHPQRPLMEIAEIK